PELAPTTVRRRASAVRGLLAPAMGRRRPTPEDHGQLTLPLAIRAPMPELPRLTAHGGREHDPDAYRALRPCVADTRELALGELRARLDRAGLGEEPIGGYTELAVARGDAWRIEERRVATRGAALRREVAESTSSVILSDPSYRSWLGD